MSRLASKELTAQAMLQKCGEGIPVGEPQTAFNKAPPLQPWDASRLYRHAPAGVGRVRRDRLHSNHGSASGVYGRAEGEVSDTEGSWS